MIVKFKTADVLQSAIDDWKSIDYDESKRTAVLKVKDKSHCTAIWLKCMAN